MEEPVGWYKGVAGGTVRRYSDTLLIFTLKGMLPDRYRERVDVRGVLAHLDVSRLPDDLVARLAAGENPVTVLAPILRAQLPSGEAESIEGSGGPELPKEGNEQSDPTNPTLPTPHPPGPPRAPCESG